MNDEIGPPQVEQWIAYAERAYVQCWEILVSLKAEPRQIDPIKVFSFQPTLADAIHSLDRRYDEVRAAEKALVAIKAAVPREEFRKRIAELARLRATVKETADIGRSLGDAFAWIFYINSPDMLPRQVARPRAGNTPSGIGGKGELAFVRAFPKFKHYFPIYHGITTFLRSGDFTLLDTRTFKVAGLIELKTKRVGEKMSEFSIHFVGSQKIDDLMDGVTITEAEFEPPPLAPIPGFQEHLESQVKTMSGVLGDKEPCGKANIHNAYHIKELRELASSLRAGNAAYQQAGPGLLLIGVNLPQMSLPARLAGSASPFDVATTFPDLVSRTKMMMRSDSQLNAIIVSRLEAAPIPGGTPLFWWPVDTEFLRAVYFREVHVGSIFNPAHLAHKLIDRGFEVVAHGRPEQWSAHKRIGDYRAELQSFAYFVWAIQYHLMREESAVEAIERTLIEAHLRPDARVYMNINHMMLG